MQWRVMKYLILAEEVFGMFLKCPAPLLSFLHLFSDFFFHGCLEVVAPTHTGYKYPQRNGAYPLAYHLLLSLPEWIGSVFAVCVQRVVTPDLQHVITWELGCNRKSLRRGVCVCDCIQLVPSANGSVDF